LYTSTDQDKSPNTPSDNDLMAAVRDWDMGRLGTLFERHGDAFYRYFVRMTRNPDTSWDLVQETFLRVMRYKHTFRDTGNFLSWGFRIAHNIMVDHQRRFSREVALDNVSDMPSPRVLPLAELERSQELNILHQALDALPVEKRELLVLSHLERMPYAEIAQVLSCSVGAVKLRVHRAVKELRQIYIDRTGKGLHDEP